MKSKALSGFTANAGQPGKLADKAHYRLYYLIQC